MNDLEKAQVIVFRFTPSLQFLMLKRIPKKGGVWQPVTGAVEKEDADILAAAFRELEEETAIGKEQVLSVVPDIHSYEFTERRGKAKETAFGMEVAPDTAVDLSKNVYPEHDEYRWISPEEAISLAHWSGQKEAMRKLRGLLEQNAH